MIRATAASLVVLHRVAVDQDFPQGFPGFLSQLVLHFHVIPADLEVGEQLKLLSGAGKRDPDIAHVPDDQECHIVRGKMYLPLTLNVK